MTTTTTTAVAAVAVAAAAAATTTTTTSLSKSGVNISYLGGQAARVWTGPGVRFATSR